MLQLISAVVAASWSLLLDSSVYILFGILISGLLKMVLNPATVVKHLGSGRFSSVIKAAFLGVPLPLCSCGVLPAAVSLKNQGANKGATTAFLISTPESGVDSIAISYALLDPIMTVIRPVAAFVTAIIAGCIENIIDWPQPITHIPPAIKDNDLTDKTGIPVVGISPHDLWTKIITGLRYAMVDVWGDIAIWFFGGLFIAGLIMVLIPDELMFRWLDGGFSSMLIMLAVGIPLYICATASTPVAAALILKGVSPGAALVFLLVGPATNITSLAVLIGILGKKGTFRYLLTLSGCAILFGLIVDQIYKIAGISPQAVIGEAAELVPYGAKLGGALLLLLLSVRPLTIWLRKMTGRQKPPLNFHSGFPDITNKS
jgi:uncharacterized protein